MSLNFGQNLFPPRGEIIASYDFIDLLHNQGFVNYYIGRVYNESATAINVMRSTPFFSLGTSKNNTATTDITTLTEVSSEDYDIEVNVSQIIEGNALVKIRRRGVLSTDGGSQNYELSAYQKIVIRRVRNGTETEIGSATTPTFTYNENAGIGTQKTENYNEIYEIHCTRTKMSKGDKLRITIEFWVTIFESASDGDGTFVFTYWTDPLDRTKTVVNYNKPAAEDDFFEYAKQSGFKATIPFKLNI